MPRPNQTGHIQPELFDPTPNMVEEKTVDAMWTSKVDEEELLDFNNYLAYIQGIFF